LAGNDVCGQAPTGSGKTIAFGIPLLRASHGGGPGLPTGLVLVPTRELAAQVRDELARLSGDAARIVALYGGTSYVTQRRALRRGVDIVVACPGRLEDLVAQGDVRLHDVRTVVIDEADRMVDMGFIKPVCRLLDRTADGRQILLFSATLTKEVASISRRYQSRPTRYEVGHESGDQETVEHLFWRAPRKERVGITARLVARHGQAFVFCRTKRGADRVARELRLAGVDAAPIHGNRSQPQRARALASFAGGRTGALVGTDIVSRGIHIEDVPCVVHFDPAGDAETYVHRSGRTGRTGNSGTVVSLVTDESREQVQALQRSLGLAPGLTTPFSDPAPAVKPTSARHEPRSPGPSATRPSGRRAPGRGRLTGTVKFFDAKRGYGFVSGSDGTDLFVHHSEVQGGRSGPMLRKGERVSFELAHGRRGHQARKVVTAAQHTAAT
jgi:superfamily II DNA/RNA helicase